MNAAEDRRQQHEHCRRHVKVEDLLHEPHRRFVARAHDEDGRGHENETLRRQEAARTLCAWVIRSSRDSNVQSDSVTNTTSKLSSSIVHSRAMSSCGSAARRAAVPRTPAIMTGIVTGYNRIGSSTSRLRARAQHRGEQRADAGKADRAEDQQRCQQHRVLEQPSPGRATPPAAR